MSSGFNVSSANVSSECGVVSVCVSSGFKVSSANGSSECVVSLSVVRGFCCSQRACRQTLLVGGGVCLRNVSSASGPKYHPFLRLPCFSSQIFSFHSTFQPLSALSLWFPALLRIFFLKSMVIRVMKIITMPGHLLRMAIEIKLIVL